MIYKFFYIIDGKKVYFITLKITDDEMHVTWGDDKHYSEKRDGRPVNDFLHWVEDFFKILMAEHIIDSYGFDKELLN